MPGDQVAERLLGGETEDDRGERTAERRACAGSGPAMRSDDDRRGRSRNDEPDQEADRAGGRRVHAPEERGRERSGRGRARAPSRGSPARPRRRRGPACPRRRVRSRYDVGRTPTSRGTSSGDLAREPSRLAASSAREADLLPRMALGLEHRARRALGLRRAASRRQRLPALRVQSRAPPSHAALRTASRWQRGSAARRAAWRTRRRIAAPRAPRIAAGSSRPPAGAPAAQLDPAPLGAAAYAPRAYSPS